MKNTILKQADLKVTEARLAVLEVFDKATSPLDAETVTHELEKKQVKVDPATIFRILTIFTEKNILKQIQFHEGKFRYEPANQSDHHHIVCIRCKKIEDVSNCAIPDLEKEINSKTGYIVKSHTLEFFGVCKTCQQ